MPHCPSCGKGFKSESSVAMHMGQPRSGCNTWINNLVRIHESLHTEIPTSADQDFDSIDMDVEVEHSVDPSNPTIAFQPPSMDLSSSDMPTVPMDTFDGAAQTYGLGQMFMDTFGSDQFSEFQKSNLYYPFASRSEWELALWLLRSGLSMRAMDAFLSLPIVSPFPTFFASYLQLGLCR